jgi:hypothetical protein
MTESTGTKRSSLFTVTLFALLLAACAGTATPGTAEPPPTSPPTNPPEPTATGTASDAEASEPAGEGTAGADGEVSTDGQLPDRLTSLARLWMTDFSRHTVPYGEIISGGVPRDGIPSIDEPKFTNIGGADEWLADTEPVVALEIDGDARAYPLGILTRHEIANDEVGGVPVVVTFCPLCNSAVVFERRVDSEVVEFGVSGLLRNSDLIMYDRATESLWQQATGEGIVGAHAGDQLDFIASSIVSYGDFKAAYPDGQVLSPEGGRYGINPYGGYDQREGRPFLFTGELDERLPAMWRVVGVVQGETAKAYPYPALATLNVVNDVVSGQELVILYQKGTNSALGATVIAEAEDIGAAAVYDPNLNGQTLTFRYEDGRFVDEETGSTWNMLGQAVEGELAGEQLEPLLHSDHFWFAWAAFYPDTTIYEAGGE